MTEALGTPDQDVHTVAGDEAYHQQTEWAHLQAGQTGVRWERRQLSGAKIAEDSKIPPSPLLARGTPACHSTCVETRGQRSEDKIFFLLPPCGSQNQTQVIGLGGQCLYLLSHLLALKELSRKLS